MTSTNALVLIGHLAVPVLVGVGCALGIKRRYFALYAAALSWLAYLVFNLYESSHSHDSELMQGTAAALQLVIGSAVALLAWAAAKLTKRIVGEAA
jgi:hypothetical protein